MPGFGGDYRKDEKKKPSKLKMEEKAKRMAEKRPYVISLPELIKKK